ncbi:hypothetical protein PPL_02390 [Heterostelium album PN500]|uniref:Uncharacterized protein n=1 Tax=Heterostelium pallidum (strain ATCC 26659 / Pp 5 / PN500) TaxID=670386 RepID=D3AZK8_HETP5|nr:hypothetical protein PPL_02390 [Heterostelium album PN500]EFA85387.1 hypothetical protein PPL_02390 [Heterostelium album PN500]|eukprot:XP_020437496.1 hypothetical protein PPL_02390 [Heterostelium album PN500]
MISSLNLNRHVKDSLTLFRYTSNYSHCLARSYCSLFFNQSGHKPRKVVKRYTNLNDNNNNQINTTENVNNNNNNNSKQKVKQNESTTTSASASIVGEMIHKYEDIHQHKQQQHQEHHSKPYKSYNSQQQHHHNIQTKHNHHQSGTALPSIVFEDLQNKFFNLIDPSNSNNITPATEINVETNSSGYISRMAPDTIQHPLTLSNRPIPSGFQVLDVQNKLEVINQLDYSKIPKLEHGLDRVITEKGVHPVSDFDGTPRFTRFLSQIHDFDSLILHSSYMIPSQDKNLLKHAKENNCKYLSSTSSITAVLTKLYFALTKKYNVDVSGFSSHLQRLSSFTPQLVKPVSIFLNYNNSVWAIDNNSGTSPKNNQILMDLGHSLEKMLTLNENEFNEKLLKSKNSTAHEFDESYVFSKFGDIMYRSQIDCYSEKFTGKSKTFDLKTRATRMIRLNCADHESYLGYHINQIMDDGTSGSYEKELYDMCRSAAIKYSLQARIGNMAVNLPRDDITLLYANSLRTSGLYPEFQE